jgi:hypothetical protein
MITMFVVVALAAVIGYSQGWFGGAAAAPIDATEQVGVAPQPSGSDVSKGTETMPKADGPATAPLGTPDARPPGDGNR